MIWATVAISRSWLDVSGTEVGTYAFQVYLHEIGHALGLGHPAQYLGDVGFDEAKFQNDSWQQSVMSYFDQDENPHLPRSAFASFVMTPMMADIAAIQDIYGPPKGGVTKGNTVYGVGATRKGHLAEIFRAGDGEPASLARNVMTIYDEGGTDRVNFSDDTAAQSVDLRAGAFSTVYGHVDALGIAKGTVIENYVAGHGADHVGGNAAANLIRGGAGADVIWGRSGADILYGNAGSDRLVGCAGRDWLVGGKGDDTYVRDAGDTLIEEEGGGTDKVISWSTATLGSGFENLLLSGDAAADGTGNGLANHLVGNEATNRLYGLQGDDMLRGGSGADRLWGGSGRDWLDGGLGRDILHGGTDRVRDIFAFDDLLDSPAGSGRDVIQDFVAGLDDIDLSQIDAMAPTTRTDEEFAFSEHDPAAFSVWWATSGNGVVLRADVTGDARADLEIRLAGVGSLGAGDLIL